MRFKTGDKAIYDGQEWTVYGPCKDKLYDLAALGREMRGVAESSLKPVPTDFVSKPAHYTAHPSGVECIQITKYENFCIGNAIKYIWRHKNKGKPIEDLRKAIFYLEMEIKQLEQQTKAG